MTATTDAMRAECEQALDAWTQGHGLTLPGHGPSIVPGRCQRCDDFRAGFNALAAKFVSLRAGREEDARLVAEMNALRAAMEAAARSLEVLSRFGTRNEAGLASNMTDLIHMRGYAASRASVARAALANRPEGG